MFPDDKAAMEWFEGNAWPDGRRCPRCGYKYTCASKHPSMPYHCSECDKRFSVSIGTVMEQSKISYRNWAMAAYLLATRPKGISSIQPRRDLGISQSAAWFLLHRLREARRTLAGPDSMAGPVEVDGVYLGGREKNKHADKKGKMKKTAVVGIRDRHTGIVRAMPVPETAAARLIRFVESNADPEAEKIHRRKPGVRRPEEPPDRKPRRRRVRPGRGARQRDGVVLGPVRRGCDGAFHHIEPKHPHRYINEFTGRLNMRALSTVGKMRKMVRGWVGKQITYRQLWPAVRCAASHSGESGPHLPFTSGMVAAINQACIAHHGQQTSYCQGWSRDDICSAPDLERLLQNDLYNSILDRYCLGRPY